MDRKLIPVVITAVFLAAFAITAAGQNPTQVAVLLLDNTGSLRTQSVFERELGKAIVKAVHAESQVSLLHFRNSDDSTRTVAQATVGADWGLSEEALKTYVSRITTVQGQTTLIDGIYFAAEKVSARVEQDKLSEGVIFLVSDGEDRASGRKSEELFRYLEEKKIKIFAVGLISQLSSERGFLRVSPQKKARTFLDDLAKRSGGRVVYPDDKQTAAAVVSELLAGSQKDNK